MPRKPEGLFQMVVENPKGETNKYEVNKELGIIELNRILMAPMPFPFEYGFIPGTWNESDSDPVDCMCIMSSATFPGCLLSIRVLGMYRLLDTGQEDYKILAVFSGDETFRDVQTMNDLPALYLRRIEFFWLNYKQLTPGKSTKGEGWEGKDEAELFINNSIKYYRRIFNVQETRTKTI